MNGPRLATQRPDALIREVALRQFGVVTRAQCLSAGISSDAIKTRLATKVFVRRHRGVYLLGGIPRGWEQDLMAAQLFLGNHCAVSHRAAAQIWKLDGVGRNTLEFSVATPRRSPDGSIRVHQPDGFGRSDWTERGPFRVTRVERTLIDLAAVLDEEHLEEALESALRLGLTTVRRVLEKLNENGSQGRKGAKTLRRMLLERMVDFVPTDSQMEVAWERVCRKGKLPQAQRQYQLVENAVVIGRVDFAWPEARVAVETDSWKWHGGQRTRWEKDQLKNNYLQLHGWIVLRFTWKQIIKSPEYVVRTIGDVLIPRLPSR